MKHFFLIISILEICFGKIQLFHGSGLELTENGVGVYYEPLIIFPFSLHYRLGLHFERTNTNVIQYPMYTETPGYEKTKYSFIIGSGRNILDDYFADNLKIGIFGEGGFVLNSKMNIDFESLNTNKRIIVGFGLHFPGGNSLNKIEFAFQNPNDISGIFMVRFRVIWYNNRKFVE